MKMKNVSEAERLTQVKEETFSSDDDSEDSLRCWDCNVNFTSKFYLNKHLFHHIKQPKVSLTRVSLPPLKITLKNTKGNSFEIVQSPSSGRGSDSEGDKLETEEGQGNLKKHNFKVAEEGESGNIFPSEGDDSEGHISDAHLEGSETALDDFDAATLEDINGIIESETGGSSSNCGEDDMVTGPIITEVTDDTEAERSLNKNNYETIPGAEPTPPPDPSPDSYPKIRIKTTGLLKDPIESTCTITEITDDNPNGIPLQDSSNEGHLWNTPSLEDPLKLPDSDDNILSLFNNNDRAKDYGFTTSDSEYISLDRLDNRNNGALQLYNPSSSSSQNPLDSLTGLPMQALAQQVSRLQPSGNGMHQQNVLINIQQFPQAPPQAPYQPPPMYHQHGQPMYGQPYQYQPPNPMYYPPAPTYPPPQHMQQPPQLPQLTPIGQPMNQPPMNPPHQMGQPPMSQAQVMPPSSQGGPQNHPSPMAQQQGQYRQTIPRVPGPRQPMPGQRMPMAPRQPMNQRAPMATRQRAPMPRLRGGPMPGVRGGVRPRLPNGPTNNQFRSTAPTKRGPETIKQEQNVQAKKKRFDVLTPDKDDDDCQVICMQPKNTDGLPQIESVSGATSESAESSIMHLSDSITLSVRNPPPKPASPKKSDAKAVANILATRGITVTPTAKPKERQDSPSSKSPSPLNLNGAVSIIPSAKQQSPKKVQESQLPTVDLTDDTPQSGPKSPNSPQKPSSTFGLPYRCNLCPAQYPNPLGLSKHKQNYHKTSPGTIEMALPLINLKQQGILQKLGQLGIHSFIPLPTPQQDGTYVLPIINARNPINGQAIGATNMVILGPVKPIPRLAAPNTVGNSPKPSTSPQK